MQEGETDISLKNQGGIPGIRVDRSMTEISPEALRASSCRSEHQPGACIPNILRSALEGKAPLHGQIAG